MAAANAARAASNEKAWTFPGLAVSCCHTSIAIMLGNIVDVDVVGRRFSPDFGAEARHVEAEEQTLKEEKKALQKREHREKAREQEEHRHWRRMWKIVEIC